LGIRDNTLILFLGDNGTGRSVTSRFQGKDYRGGKGGTTRRGHHVPLIASWPAIMKQGRVNHDLISCADFLPTICEAAGTAVPSDCDGVSFLPQLRGETGTPRDSIYMWYSPRQGKDLTVSESAFDLHHKLYRNGGFFDLKADPDEQSALTTLSADQAAAKARLQAALDKYKDARPAALDRQFQKSTKNRPEGRKNKKAAK
jgi:arylsulfatase A